MSSREHRSAYESAPENARLERLHDQLHLHTNDLGIILSVNGDGTRASVRVKNLKIHNLEDVTVDLLDVPVHKICIGDFYIDAEVTVDCECRIHYCEREIETFIVRSGINRPRYIRIHDLADAYIVPTALSDEAVSGLGDKVGLLKCMSDMAQILCDVATAAGSATAKLEAVAIKQKIDRIRSG